MQCQFIKEDNKRCEAMTIKDSKFCFMHSSDPKIKKIRKKALSKGGKNSKKKYEPLTEKINIKSNKDVVNLITQTINEVRQDKISTKRANAIGYLSNVIIRALSQQTIEEKLNRIEHALSKNRQQDN